jgi:hypothetical protein
VRNGEEEITERIETAGKFYKPVMAILLKWEMLKTGNICLFKSYHTDMQQKHGHDKKQVSDN